MVGGASRAAATSQDRQFPNGCTVSLNIRSETGDLRSKPAQLQQWNRSHVARAPFQHPLWIAILLPRSLCTLRVAACSGQERRDYDDLAVQGRQPGSGTP